MFPSPRNSFFFFSVMVCVLTVLSFSLVLHASYPGYLNPDSFWQLTQIIDGQYSNWHSPFMTLTWSWMHSLLPGPVGFIVLTNALIWGGLAIIVLGLWRVVGAWALLILVLPWAPGISNFLGHVHKDALLAAWMLMAFACALQANLREGRAGMVWQGLVSLAAIGVFLIRPNAIFAIVPLLVYGNLRLGWRRSLLASIAVLCIMPLISSAQNHLLGVNEQHPGDSIKVYHLVALSYFEGRNLLPGEWSAEESREIVDSCYSPVQWDVVAPWGQCSFVTNTLQKQGVWGSEELTRAWLGALVANPLGAYSAMAVTFKRSMHNPNSRAMFFEQPTSEEVNWVFSSPLRASTEFSRSYINSSLNHSWGRPWVFVLIMVCGGVLTFLLRLSNTRLGACGLAVIMSGSIYLLTYFPFNVSAEYRYFYWSGFAAYLGLMLTVLAWIASRRPTERQNESPTMPLFLRLAVCTVLAVMLALAAGSGRLPEEERVIVLAPKGDGVVRVAQLSTASIPHWMRVWLERRVEASDWHYQAGPVIETNTAEPLTARIKTLHHTIRLRLLTGPDGGSVHVSDGDFSRYINTRADEAGEIVLDLPPHGELAEGARHVSWVRPAQVALGSVLLTLLLFFIGREREEPRRRNTRASA